MKPTSLLSNLHRINLLSVGLQTTSIAENLKQIISRISIGKFIESDWLLLLGPLTDTVLVRELQRGISRLFRVHPRPFPPVPLVSDELFNDLTDFANLFEWSLKEKAHALVPSSL